MNGVDRPGSLIGSIFFVALGFRNSLLIQRTYCELITENGGDDSPQLRASSSQSLFDSGTAAALVTVLHRIGNKVAVTIRTIEMPLS